MGNDNTALTSEQRVISEGEETKQIDSKDGFTRAGNSPTPQELLAAALNYARRGWRVFPLHTPNAEGHCSCRNPDCKHVGKHPRTMNGLKDATTDEAQIQKWWDMWKYANIGIATGEPSGIVVLDVDPRHYGDKSLAYLQDEHSEIVETLTAATGGGGSHIFFARPSDGLRGSVSKIGEGLDIRGDGNYIVAPPSLHASGQRYKWKNERDIALIPEWLLHLATLKQQAHQYTVGPGEYIPEGKRNNTLASLAGSMRRRGMDEPEIAAALLEVNKRRCNPPLSQSEVLAIAASIARYEPEQVIAAKESIESNGKEAADNSLSKTQSRIFFEGAANLLARDFPAPKWAVNGLLSEGATVFAGAPKAGKSYLALGLAIAVATGGRALGSLPVEQGDVLYLALEDGDKRMQKRLKSMLNGGVVPQRLTFAYKFPRLDEGGLEAIEEWLKAHREARLVVVDTLKRVRPLERKIKRVYDGDYDAVSPLNELGQQYGVSIPIVHHTNKLSGNEDWFDSISGSLGLSAAVDNAMLLRRARREQQGTLYVAGRDIDDKALEVQFDGVISGWRLLGDALSSLARKILSWLNEAGESGLSRSAINYKNGNRTEGISDALAELKDSGLADFRTIPTKGKAQERWLIIAPSSNEVGRSDGNDDFDDESLGNEAAASNVELLTSKSSIPCAVVFKPAIDQLGASLF